MGSGALLASAPPVIRAAEARHDESALDNDPIGGYVSKPPRAYLFTDHRLIDPGDLRWVKPDGDADGVAMGERDRRSVPAVRIVPGFADVGVDEGRVKRSGPNQVRSEVVSKALELLRGPLGREFESVIGDGTVDRVFHAAAGDRHDFCAEQEAVERIADVLLRYFPRFCIHGGAWSTRPA